MRNDMTSPTNERPTIRWRIRGEAKRPTHIGSTQFAKTGLDTRGSTADVSSVLLRDGAHEPA